MSKFKPYKIDLSGFTGKVREVVSEAVQKKAFELGYAWPVSNGVSFKEAPVLYVESNGRILHDLDTVDYARDKNTAITAAEPRRKAKGDAAIQPMRSGTSFASRKSFCVFRIAIGSLRSPAGSQAAWALRGSVLRSALPAASRSLCARPARMPRGCRATSPGM